MCCAYLDFIFADAATGAKQPWAGGMNPKYWWSLGIIFVGIIAALMELMDGEKFDPESLPPPAAGSAAVTTHTQNYCERVIYSISQDGIKYVHESGGGTLLAVEMESKIGFYRLGRYGELEHVDAAETDNETSRLLEYALTSCDARYNPSGIIFASR